MVCFLGSIFYFCLEIIEYNEPLNGSWYMTDDEDEVEVEDDQDDDEDEDEDEDEKVCFY